MPTGPDQEGPTMVGAVQTLSEEQSLSLKRSDQVWEKGRLIPKVPQGVYGRAVN